MFDKLFKMLDARARTAVLPAPIAGEVIPLSEVHDQMFAKGLLGRGVAIKPTGNRVVAPSDGKIEATFPTGHAVAVHTDEGLDVLIHVGLETMRLNGKHFKVNASVGDIVSKGDVLIEFDGEGIIADGFDLTVPILICNSAEYASIKGCEGTDVAELDQLIVTRSR